MGGLGPGGHKIFYVRLLDPLLLEIYHIHTSIFKKISYLNLYFIKILGVLNIFINLKVIVTGLKEL